MNQVNKIFKIKEPVHHNFINHSKQSPEAIENYSVKKVINTVEGTIEKVPIDPSDIANKAYVDSMVVGAGATTFIALNDTPSNYGTVGWYVRTNGSSLYYGTTSASGGTDDHSALSNLTYASSGHIGFASSTSLSTHTGSTSIHFTEASIDHTAISNIGTNSHTDIDTHISSSAIHFTEASLDIPTSHTELDDIGTNTHAQIDTHIASSAIHYTKANISHTAIADIGTNTHAQIDTHIGSAAIHFTQSTISIPASQISDFDTEVSNNTTVAGVYASAHDQNTDTSLGSGAVAQDHGTNTTDMIINVCYGTSATPPTANTTTEGTLYIQYTA